MAMSAEAETAAAAAAACLSMCAHEYPQTWQLKEGAENTVHLSAHHCTESGANTVVNCDDAMVPLVHFVFVAAPILHVKQ